MISKYKKEDKVIITEWGFHYPGNSGMAKQLGATKWRAEQFMNISIRNKYKTGIIKNWGFQGTVVIFLVDLGDAEILIGERGIVLCKKKDIKEYNIVKFCKENYV